MMVWLTESLFAFDLTWSGVLWGLVLYLVTFLGSTVLGAWLLIKLPATYFCDASRRGFWSGRHPVLRWTGLLLKNVLGVLLVVLGVIMVFPGIPGPGIVMLVLGVMLLDFPGKRRLEQWLIHRPTVLSAMNRLRQRYGKPPLMVACSCTSEESSPQQACETIPMPNAQRHGSIGPCVP
jgi:Putative transmembrane protein (PGPGW)